MAPRKHKSHRSDPAAPAPDVQIEVCNDFEALAVGRQAWNELVGDSTYPNVFRRWEWASTWWRWFGQKRKLHLLKLACGPVLAGILPMYFARGRLGARRIAWIGSGGPTCPYWPSSFWKRRTLAARGRSAGEVERG